MEKEFHFLALSIGNVLKSGIVFPFQVGKLDFDICNISVSNGVHYKECWQV